MSWHYRPPVQRRERVDWQLELSGDTYHEVREIVERSGVDLGAKIYEDDTVKLKYQFLIEYRGVVQQLSCMVKLMEHPGVTMVNIGEYNDQKFLIEEWIDALRQLQMRLADVPEA